MTLDEFKDMLGLGSTIVSDDIETDGSTGGNCWNDNESVGYHTGRVFEGIKHLESEIDRIVVEIAPNISFMEYKTMMTELRERVHQKNFHYNEYYGNYSAGFVVSLKTEYLYQYLIKFM